MKRTSGVLLPVSSLWGSYSCGSFRFEAREFIKEYSIYKEFFYHLFIANLKKHCSDITNMLIFCKQIKNIVDKRVVLVYNLKWFLVYRWICACRQVICIFDRGKFFDFASAMT